MTIEMGKKIGKSVLKRKTKKRGSTKTNKSKEISDSELRKTIRHLTEYIQQHPKEIDPKTRDELKQLLFSVHNSEYGRQEPKVKQWLSSIEQGLSSSADLIQIASFLSGINSLPILIQTARLLFRLYTPSGDRNEPLGPKKYRIPKETRYV